MTKSRFLQPAFYFAQKITAILCKYTKYSLGHIFFEKSIDNIAWKIYNIIKVKGTRPKQIENK